MPNAQQIALNLVAQLDQGNIQEQASNAGRVMADAIEGAFAGLGDRIAQAMITSINTKFKEHPLEMPGFQIGTTPQMGGLEVREDVRVLVQKISSLIEKIDQRPGRGIRPPAPPTAPGLPSPEPDEDVGKTPDEEIVPFLKRNRRQITGGLGAIGTGLTMLGQLPGIMRQAGAAGAELENLESRMLMRGQIPELFAVQQMGGQDAMRRQASVEQATIIGGEVATVVGTALTVGLGAITGPVGLLLGVAAAGMGIDVFRRVSGFQSGVQQNVGARVQTQMGLQAEQMENIRTGMPVAVGGFRAGQAMGAPEMSPLLMGGFDANIARGHLQQTHQERERVREEIAQAGIPDPKTGLRETQQIERLREREQLLTEQINRSPEQMARSERFMVPGRGGEQVSLREFARQSGLDEEQFRNTMGRIGGGLGGVFGGEVELLNKMPQVSNMLRLQGAGLPQAPDVAAGLFQGGAERGRAMDMTREMFEDAMSAGLDKARVGQAIVQVGQRAAALGLGGAEVAQIQFQQGLQMAQNLFGSRIEGPQQDFVQRTMEFFSDASKSTGGIGGIAGLRTAAQFEEQTGMPLGAAGEVMFARREQDPAGLKRRYEEELGRTKDPKRRKELEGIINDPERLQGLSASIVAARRFQVAQMALEGASGDEDSAILALTTSGQVQTSEQEYMFRDMFKQIRAGGKAPRIEATAQVDMEEFFRTGQMATMGQSRRMKMERGEDVLTEEQGRAMATPEAQLAQSLAGVNMTNVASGLDQMGNILGPLNTALDGLKQRAEALFPTVQTGKEFTPEQLDKMVEKWDQEDADNRFKERFKQTDKTPRQSSYQGKPR